MTKSGGAIRINEKGISMRTSSKTILGSKAKSTFVGLSAILLASTAAPAFAQDEEAESTSSITISGNAAVTSDYRFRGVSLSGGDIAIQGGIDISHESGFYIGTWGSSLEGKINPYGGVELDVYGGWSGEVTSGVTVDVGLLYYLYPNGVKGVDLDYFEPYASVAATIGPVEATVGVAWAPKQDSLGNDDNLYLYTDLSAGIPNTPITLNGHLGYTKGALAPPLLAGTGDDSGLDYSVGADWAITGNLTASIMYTGVEGPSINSFTDDAVVFTLGVSF
ncbi:TorF family putative porin [Parasphingorhabdus sp.]|uniref:TorF family putative porin n=1 Tax=Parasphingorhabdus sp. TaxID=2709688 RepID=UPI003A8DBCF3